MMQHAIIVKLSFHWVKCISKKLLISLFFLSCLSLCALKSFSSFHEREMIFSLLSFFFTGHANWIWKSATISYHISVECQICHVKWLKMKSLSFLKLIPPCKRELKWFDLLPTVRCSWRITCSIPFNNTREQI